MNAAGIPADFEVAVPPVAALGEGPRWDAASGTLLWVDIVGQAVHRYDPRAGDDESRPVRDIPSLALPRSDGGVLVRVRASSVNAMDWHLMRGHPYLARMGEGLRRPKRTIPGTDVAGIVEALRAIVLVRADLMGQVMARPALELMLLSFPTLTLAEPVEEELATHA